MESSSRRSRGRKRKLTISSDSEEDNVIQKDDGTPIRHSSRIHEKRHRPTFRLPSRDEIWKDIPSTESIPNLKSLTPRKSVNNFTKVYNDYNYDDYEDTSDDEVSSGEASDSGDEGKKQHRIKHYHKRIQHQSSSSDENDDKTPKSPRAPAESSNLLSPKEQDSKVQDDVEDHAECGQSDSHVAPTIRDDEGDSDENDILSPSKRFKKQSVLDSDDESPQSGHDNTGAHIKGKNVSSSSDSDDLPAEDKRCRSTKLKSKQINLFQKFKETQAKKKRSILDP